MTHASAPETSGENPPPVSLRPEQPGDADFLFEVYASTRAAELALTNWDEPARRAFLLQQFNAMRQGYRSMFPSGQFSIIERGGEPVGRMVINRSSTELRIVDLALLPKHQHQRIGTFLMRQVCAQGAAAGKPLRLSVLKNNRAGSWYERLGFKKIGDSGFHDELEWQPVNYAKSTLPTG